VSLSAKDRKLLWALSRNECAFPGCHQKLVEGAAGNSSGRPGVRGEEAHIHSATPGGPRWDPAYPADLVETYANRIILCPTHHSQVDANNGADYSAETLRSWKQQHEHGQDGTPARRPATTSAAASVAGKRVFISYVREDSDAVDRLCAVLKTAKIPYWRDRNELGPGDLWKDKIRTAIRNESLVFLACFSENYRRKQKSFMNEELTLAVEEFRQRPPGQVWLVPVRLDAGEIPARDLGGGLTLADLHYCDLSGDRYDKEAAQLVAKIKGLLGAGQPGREPARRRRPAGKAQRPVDVSGLVTCERRPASSEVEVAAAAATILRQAPEPSESVWRDTALSVTLSGYRWRVLAVKGKQGERRALLLTDQVVGRGPYHGKQQAVTWCECDLRTWLNSEFLDWLGKPFANQVAEATIRTKDNLAWTTPGGRPARDRVFLLSIEESALYLAGKSSLDFLRHRSRWFMAPGLIAVDSGGDNAWWWLRSPGYVPGYAALVNTDGRLYDYGLVVPAAVGGVRPALWLNLESPGA
jgi:transposase-like protein